MWKLTRFMRPYIGGIILVVGAVFFQAFAELMLPNLMSQIVDQGIAQGNISLIWQVGARMLLVALGGTVLAVGGTYLESRLSSALGRDMRRAVFARAESFSLQEFNELGTASLITRTTNDVSQVQQVFLTLTRVAARAPLMAAGGVVMVLAKDPRLATMVIAILPALALIIVVVARKVMPLFRKIQGKLDQLNRVAREQLMGVRVIRAFDRVEFEQGRFADANKDLTTITLRVSRIMALLMPLMSLILNLTTVGIVWFGSKRIDMGHMAVGDMMAFTQYAMHILMSLVMMSMIFVMLPRAAASAERINEVLEKDPRITDPERPVPTQKGRGQVEFDGVTFTYPGAEAPVLENISFVARPGETTAIIGGTGSGKSTLLNLIPRFYDADSGSVRIDGVDVRQLPLTSLRERLGYVPQRAVLFSGTIASNIRAGKDGASAEEVEAAAETAQALDFILSKEGEFEAPISQGGANVSGGQKQRLAIARAVVRKPDIYLFDDSFSAVDFKTDAKLRAALEKVARDKTVIVVAQRISTIMHADQIVVLDAGRIVGKGTHKELLRSCPVYQEIAASQLGEEALA
ncbi:MAG TPA: ABC transporter ATP-binding protein [Firmicutes bacterium]|jgi:ATP-binding cassette subfamily B protein|nr:MAG: multidrug ABC transporter ATP-binding protein [Peptococcaceae bacterium 1109]HHT72817.1 ABC transporter ATP-binding protein [Bacillota bacterium]